MTARIACRHCGSLGPHVQGPGTQTHHARLLCGEPKCSRFLRWIPKPGNEAKKDPGSWTWAHPARARMRELPPSEAQLDVVRGSDWKWLAPHLRDRDMASALVRWIFEEAEA